jgi:hypothetical protein
MQIVSSLGDHFVHNYSPRSTSSVPFASPHDSEGKSRPSQSRCDRRRRRRQNNATPGGVIVATVTTPGRGQLVTFRGGNPSDPSPLVINLDGQPQAMSVVELAIGGNPVQYAWVTLMTPRGAAVEC